MATLKDTVVHDWLGVMSGITLGDDKFNAISLDEDGNIIIGDSNANGTILDGSVMLSNGTLHSPDNIDIGAGYSTESDSSGSNTSANLKLHSYGSVNIEASNSSVTVTASSGAVHLYTGSSTTSDDGVTSYTYYNGRFYATGSLYLKAGYDSSDSATNSSAATLYLQGRKSVNVTADSNDVTVTADNGAISLTSGTSGSAAGSISLTSGSSSYAGSIGLTAYSGGISLTDTKGSISLTSGTSGSTAGSISLRAYSEDTSNSDDSTTGSISLTAGTNNVSGLTYAGSISLRAYSESVNNSNNDNSTTGSISLTAGTSTYHDDNGSTTSYHYAGNISLTAYGEQASSSNSITGSISLTAGTNRTHTNTDSGNTTSDHYAGNISLTAYGGRTGTTSSYTYYPGDISLTAGSSSSYTGNITLTANGGSSSGAGKITGSAYSIGLTSSGGGTRIVSDEGIVYIYAGTSSETHAARFLATGNLNLRAGYRYDNDWVSIGSSTLNLISSGSVNVTADNGAISLTAHGTTSNAGDISLTTDTNGSISLTAFSYSTGGTYYPGNITLTARTNEQPGSIVLEAGGGMYDKNYGDGICLYSYGAYTANAGSDIRYWGTLINAYNASIQLYSGGLGATSGEALCYEDNDTYAIRVRANGDVHVEAGFGLYPYSQNGNDVGTNSSATLTLASAGKLNINAETALYLGSSSAMFGTSTPTTNNDTGRIFLVYDSSVSDNWHPCTVYVYSPQN